MKRILATIATLALANTASAAWDQSSFAAGGPTNVDGITVGVVYEPTQQCGGVLILYFDKASTKFTSGVRAVQPGEVALRVDENPRNEVVGVLTYDRLAMLELASPDGFVTQLARGKTLRGKIGDTYFSSDLTGASKSLAGAYARCKAEPAGKADPNARYFTASAPRSDASYFAN